MKALFVLLLLCFSRIAYSWDDHPDKENHKETDRIFRAAQEQTNAKEYEASVWLEREQKEFEKFRNKQKTETEVVIDEEES